METTAFKLILTAQDVPAVPDTGLMTRVGTGALADSANLGIIVLAIMGAILFALVIGAMIARKKRVKNGFSLGTKHSATFLKAFTGVVAVGALGYAGATYFNNGGVNADTMSVNVESLGSVSVAGEVDPEETKIYCGTDVVKLPQATPAGYTLYMRAPEGKLALQSEDVEAKFTAMEDELLPGTWGYIAMASGERLADGQEFADVVTGVPAESTPIRTVETVTESNDVTNVTFCAAVDSEAEIGTYLSNVEYLAVANTVNYTLSYDANGGTFETSPEVQESGNTLELSHNFMITDVEPIAPAGTALHFYGWSETGDSLSDIYLAGETINVTEPTTTLKAVWGYEKHEVTYNKNTTDEVTNLVSTQYCIITEEGSDSCSIKLTNRVPARQEYSLLGWSKVAYVPSESDTIDIARSKIEYIPGAQLELSGDLDLYAVWWAVSNSDWQAELRWGENPQDLDSHLVAVRNSDGAEVFHIYYSNKSEKIENGTISLNANLDIDDLSSYGPETITLNMLPQSAYDDYTFYYFVRNFTGEDEGKLKESDANITLIKRGGEATEFDVATAQGASAEYWNVFAIKNGQIVERNTLTAGPETNY